MNFCLAHVAKAEAERERRQGRAAQARLTDTRAAELFLSCGVP
jgi:hypothetical protein